MQLLPLTGTENYAGYKSVTMYRDATLTPHGNRKYPVILIPPNPLMQLLPLTGTEKNISEKTG